MLRRRHGGYAVDARHRLGYIGVDASDLRQNIYGGTAYLRRMMDTFGGDMTLGLAAYNAGPEAVRRYGGVPPTP